MGGREVCYPYLFWIDVTVTMDNSREHWNS